MTVEERLGSGDRFPVGMRVLAVDDDPTCLKLLEALLRRCQYHVTTTNQAITALKLLRENKDKFDLVISDVHMPDMDGFKLLELVGLEMDLPVIMLSANSDPKAVMKGIAHGACDYLLKPVRMEELKNIWQHVVRKKFDPKDLSSYDQGEEADKPNHTNSEGGNGPVPSGSSERNGRTGKKRKDQNEEDEDFEEDGHDNEDPSAQKKPRVVWSVELHRKFVAAVNQLGIDKAMPKRILDLMNVEKLTRENVASHLQKYRLYLKRIASQQANVVAAFGGRDSSYLHMGSLDGVRNYHAFVGSRQIPAIASFQQGGIVGRLNSPTGSGLYNLASSGALQLGHTNNSNNSIHDLGKLPNISFSGASRANLLQGMPTSLELNPLQQNKNLIDSSNPMLSTLSSAKFPTGGYDSSFLNSVDNTQISQATNQQKPSNLFGNCSSATLTSLSTDPFEMSNGISSFMADNRRHNDTWAAASALTGSATNTVPLSMPYSHGALTSSNLRDNSGSSLASNMDANLCNISSNSQVMSSYPDAVMGRDFQCQASSLDGNMLMLPTSTNDGMGYADIGSIGGSKPRWEELRQDHTQKPNLMYNSPSNSVPSNQCLVDNLTQSMGFSSGISNKRPNMVMINQSNFSSPMYMQNCDFERSIPSNQPKYKEDNAFNSAKLQGICNSNGYDSFDDLMSVVKREREDILMDGDIGCDLYSLETCM